MAYVRQAYVCAPCVMPVEFSALTKRPNRDVRVIGLEIEN